MNGILTSPLIRFKTIRSIDENGYIRKWIQIYRGRTLDSVFRIEGKRLIWRYDMEQLWVEPWGANSLRVRATEMAAMQEEDWALLPQEASNVQISIVDKQLRYKTGTFVLKFQRSGKIYFTIK